MLAIFKHLRPAWWNNSSVDKPSLLYWGMNYASHLRNPIQVPVIEFSDEKLIINLDSPEQYIVAIPGKSIFNPVKGLAFFLQSYRYVGNGYICEYIPDLWTNYWLKFLWFKNVKEQKGLFNFFHWSYTCFIKSTYIDFNNLMQKQNKNVLPPYFYNSYKEIDKIGNIYKSFINSENGDDNTTNPSQTFLISSMTDAGTDLINNDTTSIMVGVNNNFNLISVIKNVGSEGIGLFNFPFRQSQLIGNKVNYNKITGNSSTPAGLEGWLLPLSIFNTMHPISITYVLRDINNNPDCFWNTRYNPINLIDLIINYGNLDKNTTYNLTNPFSFNLLNLNSVLINYWNLTFSYQDKKITLLPNELWTWVSLKNPLFFPTNGSLNNLNFYLTGNFPDFHLNLFPLKGGLIGSDKTYYANNSNFNKCLLWSLPVGISVNGSLSADTNFLYQYKNILKTSKQALDNQTTAQYTNMGLQDWNVINDLFHPFQTVERNTDEAFTIQNEKLAYSINYGQAKQYALKREMEQFKGSGNALNANQFIATYSYPDITKLSIILNTYLNYGHPLNNVFDFQNVEEGSFFTPISCKIDFLNWVSQMGVVHYFNQPGNNWLGLQELPSKFIPILNAMWENLKIWNFNEPFNFDYLDFFLNKLNYKFIKTENKIFYPYNFYNNQTINNENEHKTIKFNWKSQGI